MKFELGLNVRPPTIEDGYKLRVALEIGCRLRKLGAERGGTNNITNHVHFSKAHPSSVAVDR